ncbi:hypothetical protein [Leptotrichia wadei]|jgi:hypothetical protein|uniref:hypothetical protein n=1 Tax=Leptotrichia wadei TaxID=157687 RepID=UPI0028D2124E|nr:hypothetical protein [Leptotrichia wadei]
MNEEYLLNLAQESNNKQAWIGTRPPFNMEVVDLLNCTNFRLTPEYHQKYDVVWLYEHMLSDLKYNGWKIILDETIRMISQKGKIVIRSCETEQMTIVKIKSYFYRRYGLNVFLEFESFNKESMIWTIVLNVQRENFELYKDSSWTFAMLTSGKKEENVLKFIKSIRNSEEGLKHEIIIAGPRSKNYDIYNVKYLDLSDFRDEQYAEISRKKNAIANIATKANILIAHDRYVLSDSFFSGFKNFGYDFDFLTIKQYYESGKEFPAYCCRASSDLIWATPFKVDNYNQCYESQYINGGLMIFKTNTLKNIKFNDLLMWNQMEDVEICKEFIKCGIVPRMNYFSAAKTLGISEKYTETFKKVPRNLELIVNPVNMELEDYDEKNNYIYSFIAKILPKKFKSSKFYLKIRKKLIGR